MRKYLYFMSADAVHWRSRLERLAKKGLELTAADGLFTGEFAETQRKDLHYFVVPYGKRDNYPANIDGSSYGWELVGGFNGMALYKSMPCVEANSAALLEKLQSEGCVHEDKHSIPLLQGLLFLLSALLFLLPTFVNQLAESWYLSWFGICLPLLRFLVVGALVLNVITFRTYLAAWVHGLTPWVVLGGFWLTLVVSRLDDRGAQGYFILILVILAVAGLLSLWNMSRKMGVVAAVIPLVVLCLGLIFPTVSESGVNLRGMVKGEAVVTLADLGDDSRLTGSGLEQEGTCLVGKTTYWEVTEEGNLTCEVFHCLTSALAEDVATQARADHSSDGAYVLWKGGTVWVVKCSQPVDEALKGNIDELLLP